MSDPPWRITSLNSVSAIESVAAVGWEEVKKASALANRACTSGGLGYGATGPFTRRRQARIWMHSALTGIISSVRRHEAASVSLIQNHNLREPVPGRSRHGRPVAPPFP